MPASDSRLDVILVGGGLANGLIADRLRASRPDLRLLLLEAGPSLGANHTWSFHDSDLTPSQREWLAPYVAHRWPRQEVRFPTHHRILETGYASVPSDRFHEVLSARLGNGVGLSSPVQSIAADHVVLANGQRLAASCVIDGRGPRPDPALALGYQKFLGLEFETAAPHGQAHPIIMDATVPQTDGYRFVYTLPLTPTRLLIEDTYYSNGDDLDQTTLRTAIQDYARAAGWPIATIVREEHGILPIVLAGDMQRFWSRDHEIPRAGLRAALFHPTTGYSLPDAVDMAERIAAIPDLTSAAVSALIRTRAEELWAERRFFRMLNRMLFIAARPTERAKVLARFYTLPEPLIRRFYAARLTLADQARILSGKPPVPILDALRSLPSASAWRFAVQRKVAP